MKFLVTYSVEVYAGSEEEAAIKAYDRITDVRGADLVVSRLLFVESVAGRLEVSE